MHTLHNYWTVCAASTLFRDGKICEACIDQRSMLPGVKYGCHRGSRVGSAVSGMDMLVHHHLGTWQNDNTAYIALTPFAADKLSRFRLPRAKIYVKPNFSEHVGMGDGEGGYDCL